MSDKPVMGPVVHIVATEYVYEELPPPDGEPPPEGENGGGLEKPENPDPPLDADYWVIASGEAPNRYWQDGRQEWVDDVNEASLYNNDARQAETLPSDPSTAYWLDRTQA